MRRRMRGMDCSILPLKKDSSRTRSYTQGRKRVCERAVGHVHSMYMEEEGRCLTHGTDDQKGDRPRPPGQRTCRRCRCWAGVGTRFRQEQQRKRDTRGGGGDTSTWRRDLWRRESAFLYSLHENVGGAPRPAAAARNSAEALPGGARSEPSGGHVATSSWQAGRAKAGQTSQQFQ